MARGGRGYKPPKQEPPPAPRNIPFENLLCQAIRELRVVEIRYETDRLFRTYEPAAVFPTSKGKTCVSGVQLTDPNDPVDQHEPHDFEVGKIAELRLTDTKFQPDPRFDRFGSKYKHGIICSI
jgi:hypothetical protein